MCLVRDWLRIKFKIPMRTLRYPMEEHFTLCDDFPPCNCSHNPLRSNYSGLHEFQEIQRVSLSQNNDQPPSARYNHSQLQP